MESMPSTHPISSNVKTEVLRRLKLIEGQVRGVHGRQRAAKPGSVATGSFDRPEHSAAGRLLGRPGKQAGVAGRVRADDQHGELTAN